MDDELTTDIIIDTSEEASSSNNNFTNKLFLSNPISQPTRSIELQDYLIPSNELSEFEKLAPDSSRKFIELVISSHKYSLEDAQQKNTLNREALNRLMLIDQSSFKDAETNRLIRLQEVKIRARGQIFSLLIVGMLIIGAVYLAYLNHPWVASVALGLILQVISSMFLQKEQPKSQSNGETTRRHENDLSGDI